MAAIESHAAGRLYGLCAEIEAELFGVLTHREVNNLIDDMERNRPRGSSPGNYWWPPGALKPRLKFIKRMIRQHRKNEGNERFLKLKR